MKKNKLKLGIVGHGFVGKATDYGFTRNVEKFIVDPEMGTNIAQLKEFSPQIVFICVPTPMADDGSMDPTILKEVLTELSLECPDAIKIIKSTVVPNILEEIAEIDTNIVYNPEFLREKHAHADFINSKLIIFGSKNKIASKLASQAYIDHSQCVTKEHVFTELQVAALIKYSINTFLATKVIFFNEIHDIYKNIATHDEWDDFVDIVSMDKRMGTSHMNVPGHDGKKGFGGACFPKDTTALLKYAEKLGESLSVLKASVKKNNRIRSTYKRIDKRELEQNISFDDKI